MPPTGSSSTARYVASSSVRTPGRRRRGPSGRGESVADAMDRLDRISAHRLELGADMADVAVDGAVADEARADIGGRHQVLAREHAARLGGNGFQQRELSGGQGHGRTI